MGDIHGLIFTICFLMIFIIVGLGIFYGFVIRPKQIKKRCTDEVSATCIRVIKTRGERGMLYSPVYKYYYCGQYYEKHGAYTNFGNSKVGEVVTLYINPNNPDEYYNPMRNKGNKFMGYMFLIMFVGMPLFMMIMLVRGF